MHSYAGAPIETAMRSTALSAGSALTNADISIAVHEPCSHYSLRLRVSNAGAVGLAHPGSMLVPMRINTCIVIGSRTVARLGPDEWLVLCADADTERTAAEFTMALRTTAFSLTDIGHRNVGIAVGGLRAREVLNGGCPLDLSDVRFPPGSATRTVFGKAEIVLLRPGAETTYRVECWRSFAPYVHALLVHGAREFAIA